MLVTASAQDNPDTRNLPLISLDPGTVSYLENSDWYNALEQLIPLYYEQGSGSNIHFYIAYCYRQLATVSLSKSELAAGADFLSQALEYVDTDATLYGDLGYVYMQLSLYQEAEDSFLSAVELDNSRPDYFKSLGEIAYLTGDAESANFYYRKALTLQPDNPKLTRRLQQLSAQDQVIFEGTTELSHLFAITFDKGMDRAIYNKVWEMLRDAWYHIGIELDLWPKRRIPVLLLSQEKYSSITGAPTWSGGVYEGQIKIPVAEFNAEQLRDTIYHEYLHALIFDTMAHRCPWWLNEGLAQYFQPGLEYKKRQLELVAKTLANPKYIDLTTLSAHLNSPEQAQLSYAIAYSATHFLIERFTIVTSRSILADMGEGMSFNSALNANTDYSFQEFTAEWLQGF